MVMMKTTAGRGAGLLLLLGLIGGCSSPSGEGESGVRQVEVPDAEGRAETRSIRNTESIGYAGDAVADRVDALLDAQEQRAETLDQQLEEAMGQ